MKTTRRKFLEAAAAAGVAAPALGRMAATAPSQTQMLNACAIASRHSIIKTVPTPNFFEGMLLGNGDVGVCAVVRPDALGLHIGKSDVWDIRVSEDIEKEILPFKDLLAMWQRASDEARRQGRPDLLYLETNIDFFREYTEKVSSSYSRAWPRPWPCGTVWIHWDPRWVHLMEQRLDPASGLLTVRLAVDEPRQAPHSLQVLCFVDWQSGLVSVSTDGPAPFRSVDYYPEVDYPEVARPAGEKSRPALSSLPLPQIDGAAQANYTQFSCFQHFPAAGPTEQTPAPPRTDRDRNFALYGEVQGRWTLQDLAKNQAKLNPPSGANLASGGNPGVFMAAESAQPFRLDLMVATPRDVLLEKLEREAAARGDTNPWIIISQDRAFSRDELDTPAFTRRRARQLAQQPVGEIIQSSRRHWQKFWSASAVQLQDKELERIWYQNQYFLACCLQPRKTAPGLFGNWSAARIGTAWHSDYHMDYNCQQVFWGVFSSNHVEQHLPYFELCQNLLPISEKYAREKFALPGAYFPHSAYPAPSQMTPYPAPPWGYQISETPWTVQSLWWQYLYTQDVDYLRRAYPILRAAARFVAAYAAKGADGKYHIIPTVSSENWGFTVDQRLNKDCILDLALIRFLLNAVIEGSATLQQDHAERARWTEVRDNLAPYPAAQGPYGAVWLDVADAPVEYIYNVPITMAPVFPGEQVGLDLGAEHREIARNTARTLRLEGGDDLVYQPWIRARLGTLDLEWFKRQVQYCSLPGGFANDRIRQTGGRYDDATNFDFMMRMGVWTENLSLPGVLNECLLQSYSGTLRLFPNTHNLGAARFQNLRAAGAFLVSAAFDGREITEVALLSEKGKTARLVKPWKGALKVTQGRGASSVEFKSESDAIVFATKPGEHYRVERA
jgi:alpha-L-fucosidase 2